MIFIKTKINDNVEIKVDLYGGEFRSYCPGCWMEHDVCIEDVAQIITDGGDLASAQIYCLPCSKKIDEVSDNNV